jgi:hypothetical protein
MSKAKEIYADKPTWMEMGYASLLSSPRPHDLSSLQQRLRDAYRHCAAWGRHYGDQIMPHQKAVQALLRC